MSTLHDDLPPRTAPRFEDAPPVNDRRPRPSRADLRASAARVVGTVKTVAPPVARGAVQLGALAAQTIATGATLAVVASILLLGGGYADDGIGSLLLCLLAAVLAAGLTTVFVVLLGVPLRVSRRVRLWWIRNGEIAIVGSLVGTGMLIVGMLLGGDGAPAWWAVVPGWVILGFSLAHTWWPDRWRPARLRTRRPEPRVHTPNPTRRVRGDRRRAARASYEEFLAASGRAFRGERD